MLLSRSYAWMAEQECETQSHPTACLLLEFFLWSAVDQYRVRIYCISIVQLQQIIGHCARLIGVITAATIVRGLTARNSLWIDVCLVVQYGPRTG
jgi:hypothetical protein